MPITDGFWLGAVSHVTVAAAASAASAVKDGRQWSSSLDHSSLCVRRRPYLRRPTDRQFSISTLLTYFLAELLSPPGTKRPPCKHSFIVIFLRALTKMQDTRFTIVTVSNVNRFSKLFTEVYIITTRFCASAVLAMGLCPSVCVCVCHKPVFY